VPSKDAVLIPAIASILILDNEGKRIAAKFYAKDIKDAKSQAALEKKLFAKTAKPTGRGEGALRCSQTPPNILCCFAFLQAFVLRCSRGAVARQIRCGVQDSGRCVFLCARQCGGPCSHSCLFAILPFELLIDGSACCSHELDIFNCASHHELVRLEQQTASNDLFCRCWTIVCRRASLLC
jgi:hypothetical protein